MKGELTIKGSKAIGEFTALTKRPVITVDKSLGIKTRGASTIKDVYRVERKLIELKSGKIGAFETKTRLRFTLDKAGRIKNLKDLDFGYGLNIVRASDLKKGYDPFATIKGKEFIAYKEIKYKDLLSVSISKKIFT